MLGIAFQGNTMRLHPLCVAAMLLGLAACGSDRDGGNPAAPGAGVVELTISPATDFLKLKGTERFVATARLSSGLTEAVTATWTSDASAVTVDGSGLATAAAVGSATITAAYQGRTATRTVRVLPDYGGRWAGTFFVTSCAVEGAFRAEWCAPVRGASFPARLDIVQTRDVVSGTWTLQEDATGAVQGTISPSGALALTGTVFQGGVAISISAWESLSTDNANMTGRFTLTWSAPGGAARTEVELSGFRHQ